MGLRLPFGYRIVKAAELTPTSVHVHVTAAPSTHDLAESVRTEMVRRYARNGSPL